MRQLFSRHIQKLRKLYGKFRESTLTTLEALDGHLFFYLDGSILLIPGFSLWFIDSENRLEYDDRIIYIVICFFIIFFIKWIILFSRTLPIYPSVLVRIYRVMGSFLFATASSLVCGIGYFIFWNAISGEGEPVLLSGPISQMEIGSGGRFMGKPHFVTFHYNERNIEVTVPSEEYATLSPGQTYSREMKLGGLGYYYNWGSKWWK